MGALRALTNTIGNTWQGYQGRSDEQDAVKFFTENDTTPEKLQEFSSLHPQMPLVDVYKYAGAVGKQKKARQAKDYFNSLQSMLSTGEVDPEKLKELGTKYPSLDPQEVMQMTQGILQRTNFMETVKEKRAANTRQQGLTKVIGEATTPSEYPIAGENVGKLDMEGNPTVEVTGTKKVTPTLNAGELYRKTLPYLTPQEAATTLPKIIESERKDTMIGITLKDVFQGAYKYKPESIKAFLKTLDPSVLEKAPPEKKPFEVNVANEIDTILGGMFPGYYNDGKVRAKALEYYATPAGAKAVQAAAAKYNKSKAPDIYNVVPGFQTPEGKPAIMNVRGGNIITGETQITPSAADVSEARKQVGMDAVLNEISSAFDTAEKSLPKTATERVVGYPSRSLKNLAQTTPSLTLADSLSAGFLAKFARAAGEVGTMTEGDIDRASKLVPTIHDTKEVRDGKLKQAKELYNEIYSRGRRQKAPLGKPPEVSKAIIGMGIIGRGIEKATGKKVVKYSDGTVAYE
jgi:hypothetical protein